GAAARGLQPAVEKVCGDVKSLGMSSYRIEPPPIPPPLWTSHLEESVGPRRWAARPLDCGRDRRLWKHERPGGGETLPAIRFGEVVRGQDAKIAFVAISATRAAVR